MRRIPHRTCDRWGRLRSPALWLGLLALTVPACQQKMAVQPSLRAYEPSSFFPDGRAWRPPIAGTVARGHLRTDHALYSGLRTPGVRNWAFPASLVGALGGTGAARALSASSLQSVEEAPFVMRFPIPITPAIVEHGHHRYMIYCVVCHDPLGTGRGKIVERGYTPPPSFHSDRLRDAPVGHIFAVITHGYGSMPEYRQQIPPRDRWAITAYIRALQLSQHYPEAELTEEMRREWGAASRVAEGRPPQ